VAWQYEYQERQESYKSPLGDLDLLSLMSSRLKLLLPLLRERPLLLLLEYREYEEYDRDLE